MKKTDIVEVGEKVVKQKMKPRGGNSPVIGDNGVMMEAGDASKAAKAIYRMIRSNPYFGNIFATIQSDEDVVRLASTPPNLEDVTTLKKRFVGFVAQCMMDDIRFGNEMVYTAIDIDKDAVYDWEHGRSRTPAHSEFIKRIRAFCRAYRECLGANGQIHPTTLIWWQKNYDGLVDSSEVVLKPAQPLGEEPDIKTLSEKFDEIPADYDVV